MKNEGIIQHSSVRKSEGWKKLQWIDTPGIGSVTWENEILAQDFIDSADLVVYMSHSDAAGTQQDFKELKILHDKGRRFLLLLTQSDTHEEDCDDNGKIIKTLVPKSEKDRKSMEDYICDYLRKLGINPSYQYIIKGVILILVVMFDAIYKTRMDRIAKEQGAKEGTE